MDLSLDVVMDREGTHEVLEIVAVTVDGRPALVAPRARGKAGERSTEIHAGRESLQRYRA